MGPRIVNEIGCRIAQTILARSSKYENDLFNSAYAVIDPERIKRQWPCVQPTDKE